MERVRADPVLGDGRAQLARGPHRRRPARGDGLHLETGGPRLRLGLGEERDGAGPRRIREEAAEAEPVAARDLSRQRGRCLGRPDADAAEPRVALDENSDLARTRRCVRETREQPLVVDAHGNVDAPGEHRQPFELRLARQVVRDQDVVDPGVGHHLRLAELLAGDAARAEGHLPARDLDGLVRLDVRAVREPDCVAVRLPPREVAIQPIDVDDEGRRVDLDHEAAPERCATASISTRIPPGNPACTVVRTGYGSAKAAR